MRVSRRTSARPVRPLRSASSRASAAAPVSVSARSRAIRAPVMCGIVAQLDFHQLD
jgi:hypothetical protein